MLFKDFKSFRDYDRKFVKVSNIDQRTKKTIDFCGLEEPVYGILYIDKQCGTTLRITGNERINYDDFIFLVRADSFYDMNFEIIDGTDYLNDVLNQINELYYDDSFNKLLNDRNIDEFRHKEFPNDVMTILLNNGNPEKIWVRLIAIVDEGDIYIGELLSDSCFNKKCKTGGTVGMTIYEEDGFKDLVIVSIDVEIYDEE